MCSLMVGSVVLLQIDVLLRDKVPALKEYFSKQANDFLAIIPFWVAHLGSYTMSSLKQGLNECFLLFRNNK